jgi:hypothetical protein
MNHVFFVEHKGRQILYFDFANVSNRDEALRRIADAKEFVAQQEKGSLLTLTVVTGSAIDREITFEIRELVAHNRPYVKAGAIVGVTGAVRFVYRAVARLTARSFELFDSEDDAKDWLVNVNLT